MEHDVPCAGLRDERLHDRSAVPETLMLWQEHDVEDDGPVYEICEGSAGTNNRCGLVREAANSAVLKCPHQSVGIAPTERRTLEDHRELLPTHAFEACDELDSHAMAGLVLLC